MITLAMGYQPRIKSPKGAIHVYKKTLREKRKDRKRVGRGTAKLIREEKPFPTKREVSELTLKQLHTLGSQKFGSSPFSEHFDRWLTNITVVLDEFKSHPNIGADDQFLNECAQIFSSIKDQLEVIRRKETALDQELDNLSDWRSRLKQIKEEYATLTGAIKGQRNREIKGLYKVINHLKKEQDEVIRMKTGFFHGISRKKREQKEMNIVKELSDKQTELELVMLDFSAKQKELKAEYDRKKEPVLEEIKKFRRIVQTLETDSSLEERWFACEAFIDAINSFLQRKSAELPSG
jgi:DNA repair exonuclease SbcCD ATPase subunit